MSATPPRDWAAIKWPDVDPAAAGEWIAVLPLAATEQHGPHLPVGTDTFIAEAYLARVQALLPGHVPASFLPVQSVGFSIEHIDYPGTVTLPYHVAIRHWMSLGESVARSGVKKLVMVTSHGGNSAPMAIVAQELRARLDMLAVTTSWHRFGTPDGLFPDTEIAHGIHGGAVETSIMLAAQPDLVRKDKIANFEPASVAMTGEFRWLSPHRPAPFAWAAQDLHPSGVAGDATLASADKGRQLIEHGAKAFCELLADVHAFDMARLANRPTV
ncbi:creatininase family protein [[Pseudomonas] carboxydohydrogena]|uniref:Creatininase family protein n=1 Tax=Afipia carboxydohydrogena TaxID=290 RepID=A0ABY8BPP3_AFICR|nr:creatininase family protein [[Pseudomonas] carboxydohydrogena]WEF51967.1 creatininase family protein [[Pseudomonas] carboxydohydrogena]